MCLHVYVHEFMCLKRPEAFNALGAGVTGSYEPSNMSGCWEVSLHPLEEQYAILTAGPALQLLRRTQLVKALLPLH